MTPRYVQKGLFSEPQALEYSVYHDESHIKTNKGKFFFMGFLWIQQKDHEDILNTIDAIRKKYNFEREIHFNKIRKPKGKSKIRFEVCRELFMKSMYLIRKNRMKFNAIIIEKTHPRYDSKRFPREFHEYNKFTLIGLYSGVKWFFKGVPKLRLSIFSDEKSRQKKGGLLGININVDNFEEYLYNSMTEERENYPKIELVEMPRTVPSDHTKSDDPMRSQVIQLCDLLLGSVTQAVLDSSQNPGRKWFGQAMARYILESRDYSSSKDSLYKKLSVSYFPDENGQFYNNFQLLSEPLKVFSDGREKKLWDFE